MYRKFSTVYNMRVANNDISAAINSEDILYILDEQVHKFKIQAAIGFILQNIKSGELRYWHGSQGADRLFDQPHLINDRRDFQKYLLELGDKDFIESATRNRPDTSWTVHAITNITFWTYPVSDHPIGFPTSISPHLLSNKSIKSLLTDSNGRAYSDKKCFFRALAVSRQQVSTLQASTDVYYQQYLSSQSKENESFNGVKLSELPRLERLYKVSVDVYTLSQRGEQYVASLISRSTVKYPEKLLLHLENDEHFCLITNLSLYTKSYKCNWCPTLLKSSTALKNHSLSCNGGTQFKYPSGEYRPEPSLFEKLKDVGVEVEDNLQYYPYFAVYDAETYLDNKNLPKSTPTMTWEGRHVLASISVASNIAGYTEPKTFVNDGDAFSLVSKMMDYLTQLSDIAYDRLARRYDVVFRRLQRVKEETAIRERLATGTDMTELIDKRFDKLLEELENYIRDLLVFGFNSKSYDFPLMKNEIIRYLVQTDEEITGCIKKFGNYMMVKTEKFRFLDITNFLAEGTSLSQYLKAMDVDGCKFFWPYEKFTSMEYLQQKEFPEHKDFFNTLKNSNISDDEYNHCKKVWSERGMTCLRDMLVYYNECDVVPLCMAIERHAKFLNQRQLDFKAALSISGLSIQYLFSLKDRDSPIYLMGEKFSDIYKLIRQNIRGGLSMVYNRYQEAEKTKIKEHKYGNKAKTTQVCIGKDVSAMYLGNLTKAMPTGRMVVRRRENEFRLEKSVMKGEKAVQFIEWLGYNLGIKFQHNFTGDEKRIGVRQLPVDGYAKTEKEEIVVNFSGCYYHSHQCKKSPTGRFGDPHADEMNLLQTYEKIDYFRNLGYKTYHIFECEFDEMMHRNVEMKNFCRGLKLYPDSRSKLTEGQIVTEIKMGEMFGMAEVDVHCPEHLKAKFAEFQPIVKKSMLSRDDVGSHMKKFAEDNNLLKRPTSTLLSSYFGEKILMATPLLQWLLKNGIICTKVHTLIQFKPSTCFTEFGDAVVSARREGDRDPSKKIIGDMCKLLGK